MNSRETAEAFVLDYVSSYPDEQFHRECVDTLTCIIDISRAGAKADQRQMCADEAVSEVSCYDVSLGTIRGVREACLNATGEE